MDDLAVTTIVEGDGSGSAPALQRLGAADLLPEWVTQAIFGAKDQAQAKADDTKKQGDQASANAEQDATRVAEQVDAEAPKVLQQAEQTAERAEAKFQSAGKKADSAKAGMDAKANAGQEQLEHIGEANRKLVSPGAIVKGDGNPAAAAPGQASSGGGKGEGKAAGEPACSVAKVINSVEKVADLVGRPFGLSGSALLRKIGGVVRAVGGGIGTALKTLAGWAKDLKNAYDAANKRVRDLIGMDIGEALEWVVTLTNPILATRKLALWVAKKIGEVVVWAGRQIAGLLRTAMTEGPKLLASIRQRVGSFLNSVLPNSVLAALNSIGSVFAPVTDALQRASETIGNKLRPKAENAKRKAEQAADQAKDRADKTRQKALDEKKQQQDNVAQAATDKKKEAEAKQKNGAEEPKAKGEEHKSGLKKEGQEEADKLSHKICAELDSSMGKCVEEYLPDPGKAKGEGGKDAPEGVDNTSSISATANAEFLVPIPETPIHLKASKGSKVDVTRTGGSKTYTVTITGDGAAYVTGVAGEGESADVKVDLPGGGKGNATKVWEALKGGAKPPDTGVKAKGDVDAGYRGQLAVTYAFTAGGSNCKGLGGLVALLGKLGIEAGAGVLGELANIVGGDPFEDNLTSTKFTVAAGVQVSGEVANQLGKLTGKAGGEAGTTFTQEKKGSGTSESLEIFGNLSGEAGAELDHGFISGITGSGNVGAGISVILVYDKVADDIYTEKVSAKASGGVAFNLVSLSSIASIWGPEGRAALDQAVPKDEQNWTGIAVKGDVNVDIDGPKAQTYLEKVLNDPAAASKGTVLDTVKDAYKQMGGQGKAVLSVTKTERLAGVGVEVEERKQGQAVAGKGAVAIDRSETRVLLVKTF